MSETFVIIEESQDKKEDTFKPTEQEVKPLEHRPRFHPDYDEETSESYSVEDDFSDEDDIEDEFDEEADPYLDAIRLLYALVEGVAAEFQNRELPKNISEPFEAASDYIEQFVELNPDLDLYE
jgi:hypothetical protein